MNHAWVYVPRPGEPAPGRDSIGGKAAALAALATVRGPGGAMPEVPRWVVLRSEAFAALAPSGGGDDSARRSALLAMQPPAELRAALRSALEEAGLWGHAAAVRSSAAAEDGASASFAGQYESVLGVPLGPDDEELWAAIGRVWASTASAHATSYGATRASGGPAMAVLVQEMVEPIAAGVAFDADPVTGDRDAPVVSAVWGLGEALVSGETDADTFRMERAGAGWRVRERTIADKVHAVVVREGRTERVALSPARAHAPALDDAQAATITEWTRAVSDAFGAPQDVEWALVGEPARVVLLQARNITTLLGAGAERDEGAPARLGVERRIWDNSNIVESYAGVTSPLTFTFARAVYEDVYRQFCALMGVPAPLLASHAGVFANMLGLVRGRVYYQLLNWYRTLGLLPGFGFNRGFMERMMGVRERLESPPPPPGSGDRLRDFVRFLAMVVRMVRESRALGREVPDFHARVQSVLGPLANQDFSDRSPIELVALYRRLERELLAHWRAPLVNDFFAMMFFGLLCRIIERWLPGSPATLANDLLCGEGGIISTEPARAVMSLAREVVADPVLSSAFAADDGDAALWDRLHRPPCAPAFAARLDAYVARFGDRCMNELKLETVTLGEDPGFLLAMVRTYVVQGTADPEAALAREHAIRSAAEARANAGLRGVRGWLFRAVLGQARARVRDRENLRFERTRVFGVIRRLVLALGGHLAAAGRLETRRDVFHLTIEELLASVDVAATTDYRPRVTSRRARFDAWARQVSPPDRFETSGGVSDWLAYDPPELSVIVRPVAHGGDTLQGLGCCPGVVRALVRVVHDPAQARELAGRILVAERTDPGWTLLFPAVSGLLVQRGSLLSHSAIVAREMGIPCVVGIPHLLDTLRDGDEVEFDGTTGTVRRLHPAAGEARA